MSSAVRAAIRSHVRVFVAKRCALIVIVEVSFSTCEAVARLPRRIQPKVNTYASTPGSRNVISKVCSPTAPGWRTSW
jgi:hypothetical protein